MRNGASALYPLSNGYLPLPNLNHYQHPHWLLTAPPSDLRTLSDSATVSLQYESGYILILLPAPVPQDEYVMRSHDSLKRVIKETLNSDI